MESIIKRTFLYLLVGLSVVSCSKDDGPQLSPAEFSADVSTLDFGEVEINQQSNLEVTVTNTGEQELVLKSFTLSGTNASDFTIDEAETVIEGDKSYTITITFAPTTEGAKAATLTIVSNVGEHQITLNGNGTPDPNPVINIPDPNFKAALLAHELIDANKDGEIRLDEAESYTGAIEFRNRNISDLTGIESFINIILLDINSNQINKLDISKNSALQYLSCSSNQLTNLDVSQNKNLTSLYCSDNKLLALDINNNTLLQTLNCARNEITDLDVSTNTELIYLGCSDNSINILDISNNTVLQQISCGGNTLSNMDFSNNINLRDLNIQQCDLTQIDISKNLDLEVLTLDGNQLSELNIENNNKLKRLRIAGNLLTNLDISNLTSLESLYLASNLIDNLDTSNSPLLKSLVVSNNPLSFIDVSSNPKLAQLWAQNNASLTTVNLANGNNQILSDVSLNHNDNLSCIQVDAGFTPPSSWKKDDTATYSDNCQ